LSLFVDVICPEMVRMGLLVGDASGPAVAAPAAIIPQIPTSTAATRPETFFVLMRSS
jgi:hypothetical protein